MNCSSCHKDITKKPFMKIFTVDSGIDRAFCLDCVKYGYKNLKAILAPKEGEIDLMVKFEAFIKKNRKVAES